MKQLIYAYIWDVADGLFRKTKKSDRAILTTIHCEASDKCDVFKQGKCVLLTSVISGRSYCPYGTKKQEAGFTKGAKGFYKWVDERRHLEKEALDKFGKVSSFSWDNRLHKIGDYYLLPDGMNHLRNYQNTSYLVTDGVVKESSVGFFIHREDILKKDVADHLISYVPLTAFGHRIDGYKVGVEGLLESVKRFFPELREVFGVQAEELVPSVGRGALVKTIGPGKVFMGEGKSREEWLWDGEFLRKKSRFSLEAPSKVHFESIETVIKPSNKTVAEIASEDQVREDTVFIN